MRSEAEIIEAMARAIERLWDDESESWELSQPEAEAAYAVVAEEIEALKADIDTLLASRQGMVEEMAKSNKI